MTKDARVIEDDVVHPGYWRVRRVVIADADFPGERLVREIVEARQASAVLLHDPVRNMVMLVRQFRPAPFVAYGVRSLLEVSAGVAEPGEDAAACAIREVREETGLAIESPRPIGRIYPSPGVCTERLDLFIAEYSPASQIAAGGGLADEGESTEPIEIPFEAALASIETGAIEDAKTIVLLQRLALEKAR